MPTTTTKPELRCRRGGFTLIELMVAATVSAVVLMAVLGSQAQLIRSSIQATRQAEMEAQVRNALETFGIDLRSATRLVRNGAADITLTLRSPGGDTELTYARDSATGEFFSVPGASSSSTTGRRVLARNIPAEVAGNPGLIFEGFDNNNNATTQASSITRIQVSLTVVRDTPTILPAVSYSASAGYILRNKELQ